MLSRSVVSDSVIPWTVAHQAPLSLGFPRQEYWSGLPCPPPGDLPDPGMEPSSHTSPALAGGFFTASTTWMPPDILLAFIQVTVNISRIGVITVIKVNILLCLMFVAEWKGQGKNLPAISAAEIRWRLRGFHSYLYCVWTKNATALTEGSGAWDAFCQVWFHTLERTDAHLRGLTQRTHWRPCLLKWTQPQPLKGKLHGHCVWV